MGRKPGIEYKLQFILFRDGDHMQMLALEVGTWKRNHFLICKPAMYSPSQRRIDELLTIYLVEFVRLETLSGDPGVRP